MTPIQEVQLPDPRKGSRKFTSEDAVYARDLLTEGKQASDGDLYEKESTARSAGDSLKKAVEATEGAGDLRLGVRVVGDDSRGFEFAVVVREASASGAEAVNPDSHTKAELLDLADKAGVGNSVSEDSTKAEIAEAINAA